MRAAGVVHTKASAGIGRHEFHEQDFPVIQTGYGNESCSITHTQPLTWEAAENLYKDLALIFGEKEVRDHERPGAPSSN